MLKIKYRFALYPLLVVACISLLHTAQAQQISVPNSSFENGQTTPDGWISSDNSATNWEQEGRTGQHSISVSTTPNESSVYWELKDKILRSGQVYRFTFWAKSVDPMGGVIISGPSGTNHDFPFSPEWTKYSFIFMAPDNPGNLRLGQWGARGKVLFDDVQIEPVIALSAGLSGGEQVKDNTYSFTADLARSNYSRPLLKGNAGFNTNRWVFSQNSELIYQHQIANAELKNATLAVTVSYYKSGSLQVDASRDGINWIKVGTLSKLGVLKADLPASLFPATTIQVRLRAEKADSRGEDSAPGSFQVSAYSLTASLSKNVDDAKGTTQFIVLKKQDPQYPVKVLSAGTMQPGSSAVQLQVQNPSKTSLKAQLILGQPQQEPLTFEAPVTDNGITNIPYQFTQAGEWQMTIRLMEDTKIVYESSLKFVVPVILAADYGKRVDNMDDIWWSESSHKIGRNRALPAANNKSTFVPIQLARNEYEAVQIVARPTQDVSSVKVTVTDLTGPNGAAISGENITIDEVAYVPVGQPTDERGASGNWPDALPPLTKPINLQANRNQPFWVTVFAPKGIPGGTYKGKVLLAGSGWQREVPLQVTVWDFDLPDTSHLKSAFGLSASRIAPYHHVSGDQLSEVMEKYYRNFSDHRISPYNPVYGSNIKVDWGLSNTSTWLGGTMDTRNPYRGKHSMHAQDTSPTSSVAVAWKERIPVKPGAKYQLQFAVRTALDDQKYMVSLAMFDAENKKIPHQNFDYQEAGNKTWREVKVDITERIAQSNAHFVSLSLRPVPWTQDGSGIGDAWFDDVRLIENETTDLLGNAGSFEEDDNAVTAQQVKIDFTGFDAAMENAVKRYGFTSYRLPLVGVGRRGEDANSYIPGKIGTYVQGSAAYETLFGSYVNQLQNHLEKKGWLDMAFLYWIDEPDTGIYQQIAEMSGIIHRYAPKLKWLLTEQPEPELNDAVDIFCPVLDHYDHQKAIDLQNQGKDVWWYICTVPKAPYVGEFIDRPGIEPRLWIWQTWQNKVQGVLIWETVYWTSKATYANSLQNPWEDAQSWSTRGAPWGSGDGRWLYPPRRDANTDKTASMDDPVNSTRWENLRDGMEDYEYFWMLQQQVKKLEQKESRSNQEKSWLSAAKVLLEVPDSISKNLTEFTTDPMPLLSHRARMADAIIAAQ